MFIVSCNDVGSNQMHQVRQSLLGEATVVMGINTTVRRALNDHPKYKKLIPHVKGNVEFVFTNGDLKNIREKDFANRVAVPRKLTRLPLWKLLFPPEAQGRRLVKPSFSRLGGSRRELQRELSRSPRMFTSSKRTPRSSEATLLNNISPFTDGFVYYGDGTVFLTTILDVTNDHCGTPLFGIMTVAAISLATRFPTVAAVPHLLANTFKNLAVFALTDYAVKESKSSRSTSFSTSGRSPRALCEPAASRSCLFLSASIDNRHRGSKTKFGTPGQDPVRRLAVA
ncbi:MAG: LOW QUALITY PROTEIN: hypothetical protein BJ554DRAFT_2880 [Olpidium bornovanus]|uniref:Uncharacterized protein n=1 Tax=Olpidium bornovanus TaxID=278681 RepID=A0A8H7ZQ55_9FUNG|nr:MAG: LOW QUALITY PROTEIN: hypothetical protein BJ554DRAFT_2880 [Olpidium bornovanus]